MAIFPRLSRKHGSSSPEVDPASEPVPEHLLPEVNQRVSVALGERIPAPTRIEDIGSGELMLADPSLPLDAGDRLVVAWERDGAWLSLETQVVGRDLEAIVPIVRVRCAGRLSRYDERRATGRRDIELPLDLRVTRARAVKTGRLLQTRTMELGSNALRFVTSAPFAPGDIMEAKLHVVGAGEDTVSVRLRVIRMDVATGSWRQLCTAVYDEILRADRARILGLVEAPEPQPQPQPAAVSEPDYEWPLAGAPTADGVGGRDEPHPMSTLDDVIGWIRGRRA